MSISVGDILGRPFWSIFVSLLVIYLPALGAVVLGALMAAASARLVAGSVIINVALSLMLIAGWVASVGIFSLLNQAPNVSEVLEYWRAA